jgi:competence protein ComEC
MDDIQKKLALIDKQIAGGNLHRRIIDTCPMLFIAAGLIIGILFQRKLNLTITIWLAMLATICAIAAFIYFGRNFPGNRPYVHAYLALFAFICFGAIRLTDYHRLNSGDISNLVPARTTLATIRGIILTEPYINRNQQWQFARFQFTDPSSSFYLNVQEAKTVEGWTQTSGTIWTSVNEPVLDLRAGDCIEVYCRLDRFTPPANPGQFDTAKYMAERNIFIAASVETRNGIEILQTKRTSIFFKIRNFFRQVATTALSDGSIPGEPDVGLLQALLLGYRKNIDSDTYEAFRRTGLLHIISLSGMHFGILIGIVWWLSKIAGLMKPARAVICIIASIVFTLVVPPNAPTLRAAVICFVFCISIFFRRNHNSVNTLSLSAIILLLARPSQLFEVDWQLSFASVLGILVFGQKITSFFQNSLGKNIFSVNITPLSRQVLRIISNNLIMAFSVGCAAWLGGAGILLYHFHTITPLVVLWTMIVSPLVGAIMLLGFLKIILFFIFPTTSSIFGTMAISLSALFIQLVKWMAQVDISQIMIGSLNIPIIILYYLTILFTAFAYIRRPLIKRVIVITAALIIVIHLGVVKWHNIHRDNLLISCLDVGHGQAILVRLPDRGNILFDTGSMYRSDIGRRIVIPFLDYIGIDKLDAVIISHNDIDHINGIPEIAKHCKIRHIYANEAFFTDSASDPNSTEGFLNQTLRIQGQTIERLDTNPVFGDKIKIKFLWPAAQENTAQKLSDNDTSLVTLLEFADRRILLCSDIEKFAQNDILRLYPDLNADVVVLPHHGSASTLNPDFLEKLGAEIMICSCSQEQYKSINKSADLKKILYKTQKAFFTYNDGAVTISIDKKGHIISSPFKNTPAANGQLIPSSLD